MNIESWCQVEGSSNQQWTRATRRHSDGAFKSSVFDQERAGSSEGRLDWSTAKTPSQSKHAEKKHFQQSCECSPARRSVTELIHCASLQTKQHSSEKQFHLT